MSTQSAESHNSAVRASGKVVYLNAEARRALTAWTRAKQSLRERMPHEDFQAVVRPMYLAGVLSGRFFIVSIPPNRRLLDRARNFRDNLAAAIECQGYYFAGFTRYPTDDDLLALWDSPNFGPFFRLISRTRIERVLAQRDEENARDRERLA
jgi:hypothetical protein